MNSFLDFLIVFVRFPYSHVNAIGMSYEFFSNVRFASHVLNSGPFVSAIGKAWHPEHFVCDGCGESLQNQGFIEEGGKLYCEKDYNKYFAPHCDTCKQPISGVSTMVLYIFYEALRLH